MRIKVKLRAIINLFHLEKISTREIFKDVLDKQTLNLVSKKYPTLEDFQEADKSMLVSLTGEKGYEVMKETVSKYVDKLIVKSTYIASSNYLLPVMRVAYGKLAEDAEIYFQPFIKVQEAIEGLSDSQQKFLNMYYGFTGTNYSDEEIRSVLKISVSVEEYKRIVLERLRDNLTV